MAEFQGTSYFTSSIGGAVRWSAPELYRVYEDHAFPVVTVECDIYSFGSVTLQVCITSTLFFSIPPSPDWAMGRQSLDKCHITTLNRIYKSSLSCTEDCIQDVQRMNGCRTHCGSLFEIAGLLPLCDLQYRMFFDSCKVNSMKCRRLTRFLLRPH